MINHINAAYIFTFFTAIVVVFQFALALGVPWGQLAMGGKFPGRLPVKMRIAALVQIVILIITALIVLTRAGLLFGNYLTFSEKAIWGVVVFSAVGAILNTITPSKWERVLWAPVTIILFVCSIYIALS